MRSWLQTIGTSGSPKQDTVSFLRGTKPDLVSRHLYGLQRAPCWAFMRPGRLTAAVRIDLPTVGCSLSEPGLEREGGCRRDGFRRK
jgi:hypothetical protein